jgi:dihydroxyacid dehydratase/phosphogluconate dehydratase
MNFNTLSGSAKMYKKLEVLSGGQSTPSGEVPNIAILCAVDQFENQKLINSIASGVKAKGGIVSIVSVPSFGYFNKINPMTAKYAGSFARTSCSTAEAIIKCGLYDGAVIVTGCDITASGLLMGTARANCPTLIMPTGTVKRMTDDLHIQGKLTGGLINAKESDTLIANTAIQTGIQHNFTSISTFFILMESMGFCVPTASITRANSAPHHRNAGLTGEQIFENARNVLAPKKFLTQSALRNATALCLSIGGDINALSATKDLVRIYDGKIPHGTLAEYSAKTDLIITPENQSCWFILELGGIMPIIKQLSATPKFIDDTVISYNGDKLKNLLSSTTATELETVSKTARIILCKGSACQDGGYAQPTENTHSSISGKAWVYSSLEEADKALVAGNIPPNSIIVVHNCIDTYVTALALTIEGMGKQKEIAIATDGLCDKTSVLVLTRCTPTSLDNESFANIQNGDQLEIDLGRGRFNTNVMAKDQKTREKKNSVKKPMIYFN